MGDLFLDIRTGLHFRNWVFTGLFDKIRGGPFNVGQIAKMVVGMTCMTGSKALIASIYKRTRIRSINWVSSLNLFTVRTDNSVTGAAKVVTIVWRVWVCACGLLTAPGSEGFGRVLYSIAAFGSLVVSRGRVLNVTRVHRRLVSVIVAVQLAHLAFVVVEVASRNWWIRFNRSWWDLYRAVFLNRGQFGPGAQGLAWGGLMCRCGLNVLRVLDWWRWSLVVCYCWAGRLLLVNYWGWLFDYCPGLNLWRAHRDPVLLDELVRVLAGILWLCHFDVS